MWLFHRFYPLSIGAGILVRKIHHEAINGFDESIILGEDHDYSARIKKASGKYGLITSKKILYSVRRFEKEGPWSVAYKWYRAMFSFLLHGPVRKKSLTMTMDIISSIRSNGDSDA